ncbi:50S ribosomal protein L22 [Candidatus Parcubacteria bacterium]|nr:50S ribosomal protein L22 [Candidatus Parcubacteria bacterium]
MEVRAKAKHIRMSPRKVRLVADIVRGLTVENAVNQLRFTNKKAVLPVKKLIESAIASAENNYELKQDNLFIKEIRVDEGATMKRWMPRARGRATPIRKRTSHINLILGELIDSGKIKAKKVTIDAPVKLGAKAKEDEGVKVKSKDDKDNKKIKESKKEADNKKIIDPRGEGRGKHTKIEGKSEKGFMHKVFRRKSG